MTLRQFSHWFENKFWYHYKWHAIGVIGAVLMLALFVTSVINRETPDFIYLLAVEDFFGELQLDEWDDPAREHLSDLNGDGRVIIQSLFLAFDDSEMGMAARVKFTAEMLNDDLILMVVDKKTLSTLRDDTGFLLDLSELGLSPPEGSPWCKRVEPPSLLRQAGVKSDFYLCVKALSPQKRARPEVQASYEQAAAFARMIFEMSE